MFGFPLDVILLFAVTMPFVGWLFSKSRFRSFCGIYVIVGLLISAYSLYTVSCEALVNPVRIDASLDYLHSSLKIDALGVFMTAIIIAIGIFTAIYSLRFMERDTGIPLYYTLLMLMIAGMTGVVFANDFFTLFIFWELMSISSYILVAFRKQNREPIEAGLKYLVMGAAGSASLLFGIGLIYGLAGTLNFEALTSALSNAKNGWLYFASLLVFTGFGIKAAIVPLHTWLPDAYSAAPSSISAILSAVVTETGIYALCRVFFTVFNPIQIEWPFIFAILSIITMTFGNIVALLQTDLKRLLAYSSIGHIGYMLVGLASANQLGLTGTMLHILNHALMKGAAFFCAGALIYRLGAGSLDEIAGAGRKMPITMIALGISLFALMGMPPTNGFISELTLFMASVQANMAWLGIAIVLNSALSAGYYLRVIRTLIQPAKSKKIESLKEAPALMLIPICIMAALIILFGIWPDPIMELARKAAAALPYVT